MHSFAPPSITGTGRTTLLRSLRAWVARHYGISFSRDQLRLFTDRVDGVCRDAGLTREGLLEKLRGGDAELSKRFAEAVSTNHTFFFREPESFEFLARSIFRTLPDGPLRFWSAAASSGDEAYSLAITAIEVLGSDATSRLRILGTDISERQIRAAEHGSYPLFQLQQVHPERITRWFVAAPRHHLRVVQTLRDMCTFRRMNLTLHPWPFEQRFHVIFLRNVLYYFDAPTRRDIVEACFDATEPGGFLVTSLTEPMLELSTRWTQVKPAIYRRERT